MRAGVLLPFAAALSPLCNALPRTLEGFAVSGFVAGHFALNGKPFALTRAFGPQKHWDFGIMYLHLYYICLTSFFHVLL